MKSTNVLMKLLFLLQICVWLSTSPSPLPPSQSPRRVRTSRCPVLCPSGVVMLLCPWWNGLSCQRAQTVQRMNSSSPALTWGRPVSMATTQKVSHGLNSSWRWWSRGRSLTCWSWMCPRGTGVSTCAGCRSLKSTRTAGRPPQTAPPLRSSEVRAGFIVLFHPVSGRFTKQEHHSGSGLMRCR